MPRHSRTPTFAEFFRNVSPAISGVRQYCICAVAISFAESWHKSILWKSMCMKNFKEITCSCCAALHQRLRGKLLPRRTFSLRWPTSKTDVPSVHLKGLSTSSDKVLLWKCLLEANVAYGRLVISCIKCIGISLR